MDKRKNFNTTLNIDLLKRLKRYAFESEQKINDVLESAIEEYLDKKEKPTKKKKES